MITDAWDRLINVRSYSLYVLYFVDDQSIKFSFSFGFITDESSSPSFPDMKHHNSRAGDIEVLNWWDK